jgi:glutamate carboxypeptidase
MKNDISTILSLLDRQRRSFINDLATLVNIDSGTDNKVGVDQIADWLGGRLRDLGAHVQRHHQSQFGDFLLARWTGAGKGRILVIGHMDTVYPVGTAAERPLRIEGPRALGPGIADMKAGLLAGLYAISALRQIRFDDFAEVAFWINSDEEAGSPASRNLTTAFAKNADIALVLEPARANGDIVSARKGNGKYKITVRGRAAHAGVEPEKGAHAILELAHIIIELHNLNGLRRGVTVNADIVQGGSRLNVIPERAVARVDVRVPDTAAAAAIHQAIHALAGPGRHVSGTRVTVGGDISMPPMPLSPATRRLVKIAQEIAREIGFDLRDTPTGGGSDGNFAASVGTPVLDGLGPTGGLVHSPHEYLETDSIVPRTALLAGLIMHAAKGGQRT